MCLYRWLGVVFPQVCGMAPPDGVSPDIGTICAVQSGFKRSRANTLSDRSSPAYAQSGPLRSTDRPPQWKPKSADSCRRRKRATKPRPLPSFAMFSSLRRYFRCIAARPSTGSLAFCPCSSPVNLWLFSSSIASLTHTVCAEIYLFKDKINAAARMQCQL